MNELSTMREMAQEAMRNAYAPYSHYRVGACLEADDGTLYRGCNMENAAYGSTLCAERGALMAAVAAGKRHFTRIVICSEGSYPWPCGACRQALNEFSPDLTVHVIAGNGDMRSSPLRELLPEAFGPENL